MKTVFFNGEEYLLQKFEDFFLGTQSLFILEKELGGWGQKNGKFCWGFSTIYANVVGGWVCQKKYKNVVT